MRDLITLDRLPIIGLDDPSSSVLAFGGAGCNFRHIPGRREGCAWCANHNFAWAGIAEVDRADRLDYKLSPKQAVQTALQSGVRYVAYGYAEPSTQSEWVNETMRLARAAGLKNIWETNGWGTRECLELAVANGLDAMRVGIRGSQIIYDRILPGVKLAGILDTLKYAKELGVWVEVVISVLPTLQPQSWLIELATWVKDELGAQTPFHLEPIHPAAQWTHQSITRQTLINLALEVRSASELECVHVYDAFELMKGGKP